MNEEKRLMDIPDELMPEAEELPGELKNIAKIIGVVKTIRLAQKFRGCKIYIHNVDHLLRKTRDLKIRKAADEGNTIAKLAIKFKLSTRQVINILKDLAGEDNSKGEAK